MKEHTRFCLTFFLSTLFLSGCGGSSGNSSASPTDITQPGSQVSDLEGSWYKSCGAVDPTDANTHYDIVTLTFSGNEFYSEIENYEDGNCLTPLAIAPNPTASGTFELGSLVTTTNGAQATEIDTHIDTYNGASFTIDDHDIYRIDTDILYLGEEDSVYDGSSPALRPQTLDFTRPFYRQ